MCEVEPHHVVLGPDGSYVTGWCRLCRDERVFRLDRIHSVEPLPGHAVFYIAVIDVATTCKAAEQLGGKVASKELEPPAGPPFAYLRDPVGSLFRCLHATYVRLWTVSDAAELYDELTDDLLYDPAVGRSTMVGYPCVRRSGRFFASFDPRAEALVIKLPLKTRSGELVANGTGEPFARTAALSLCG